MCDTAVATLFRQCFFTSLQKTMVGQQGPTRLCASIPIPGKGERKAKAECREAGSHGSKMGTEVQWREKERGKGFLPREANSPMVSRVLGNEQTPFCGHPEVDSKILPPCPAAGSVLLSRGKETLKAIDSICHQRTKIKQVASIPVPLPRDSVC